MTEILPNAKNGGKETKSCYNTKMGNDRKAEMGLLCKILALTHYTRLLPFPHFP